MKLVRIDSIPLRGKRVLLQIELPPYNHPFSDYYVQECKESIDLLTERGASILIVPYLIHHSNQPISFEPYVTEFEKRLSIPIQFCQKPEDVNANPESIQFLENLSTDATTLKSTIKLFSNQIDLCVNDAFHSLVTYQTLMTAFCKLGPTYAGMKLFERIDAVTDLQLGKPSPVGYIMGGQDLVSTIAVLRKNLSRIDTIMVGGIIGNTILKGNALQMGSSVIDRSRQSEAFQIVERARLEECHVELPVDHIVSDRISANKAKVKSAGREVAEGFMAVDIGNKTLSNYEKLIKKMQAVYMHGPVGASEVTDFQAGTIRLLKVLSKHSGRVILSGEELCLIAVQNKLQFSLMFTDSQVIQQWLSGIELPTLATLEQS